MAKKELVKHICTTGKCKSYNQSNKNITLTKDRKRYHIINDNLSTFNYYDIDDCVFLGHNIPNFKLCDYTVTVKSQGNKTVDYLIFVELKGQHKEIAFEQIYNTSNHIIEAENIERNNQFVRIIYNSIKKRRTKNKKTEVLGTFEKLVFRKFGSKKIRQTTKHLQENISAIIA